MSNDTHRQVARAGCSLPVTGPRSRLMTLVTQARALTDDAALTAERRDLDALAVRLVPSPRRLVVVGEPLRGKTRLVNILLGRDVLACEPTSRPCLVTAAAAGPPGDWDLVSLGQPILGGALDEILDLPGAEAGDTSVDRLRPLVVTAAVVVLAVAATSPFSLSERDLILALMADRLGPGLVVAVTMIDRLDGDERERVLTSVARKVRKVAPAAAVVPSDGHALAGAVEAALVAEEQGQARHVLTTSTLLAGVVQRTSAVAAERCTVAALGEERAEGLAEEARREHSRVATEWEALVVEVTTRRLRLVERVEATARNSRDKVTQQLVAQVRMSPDPGVWWRQDLHPRLWQELEATTRLLERRLAGGLAEDIDWLAEEIRVRTGAAPLALRPDAVGLEIIRLHAPTPGMPNLALVRSGTIAAASILFTARVAMSGALTAVLPAAALGGAAFAVGSLVTKGGVRRAGDGAAKAIPALVERQFEQLTREIDQAARVAYHVLETRLRDAHEDWLRAQEPGTRSAGSDAEWSSIHARAQALAEELVQLEREVQG